MGSNNIKNRVPGSTAQPRRKKPIYAVLNHDKIETDMREGTIVAVTGWDAVLMEVSSVSGNNRICVWPHELCIVNGYPPERSMLRSVREYKQSTDVFKDRQIRMDHIHKCQSILADLFNASRNHLGTESFRAEIESALTLLEYYEHHLDWKKEYPNGELFFICCIGKAILILRNAR